MRYVVRVDDGRWVPEDEMIMQAVLGQALPAGVKVRHINGVRNDNRLENLFLQLPTEPLLVVRMSHTKRRCARCDNEFFISPDFVARLKRRNNYCCRLCHNATCYVPGRAWVRRDWPAPPDPDRWRSWMPALAWATRMALHPDPGPGHPQRYPDIIVTPPPDDLPYFGRYGSDTEEPDDQDS